MRLSSDSPLALELRDPEMREQTVASQVRIGVPFQLRAMREKRGLTQEAVAEKLGTTQNTISRLENPRTGKPTIKTLLRFARVFDVGLLVRFVPFRFYGDVIEAMDTTHVEVPSYDEELANECAAASRGLTERVAARATGLGGGVIETELVPTSDDEIMTIRRVSAAASATCQVDEEPAQKKAALPSFEFSRKSMAASALGGL